jgi:N-acetyl sugar amidotransferase
MCTRCVMDGSDPDLSLDSNGVCNHCRDYETIVLPKVPVPAERQSVLEQTVQRIKDEGRGQRYDCIAGVSGGVDSSYVVHLAVKLGLRPLAVHVDNGWNSEAAVRNIERLLTTHDLDLVTHVIEWEEFRALQLAFLRAGVVDMELLTDHAITAHLHRTARVHGVRHILSGNNYATEFGMPPSWAHRKSDLRNLKAIARTTGTQVDSLPTASTLHLLFNQHVRRIEVVGLLNYVDYNKAQAMQELTAEAGWEYYGGKHYESLFTRFYQAHILPTRFGIDKRTAHVSSMVRSGQLSRDEGLVELDKPLYDPALLATDKLYVAKKWNLTVDELDRLLEQPPSRHLAFPSDETYIRPLLQLKASGRLLRRHVRSGSRAAAD